MSSSRSDLLIGSESTSDSATADEEVTCTYLEDDILLTSRLINEKY